MITRVRVKNFRSLADVDVTLGPLTVLVGRNGAGKSAFIDVMRFVRDALTDNLDNAIEKRGGLSSLRRWMPDSNSSEPIEIIIDVEHLSTPGQYSFQLAAAMPDSYAILSEKCNFGAESFERNTNRWSVHGFPAFQDQMMDLLDSKALVLPTVKIFGNGSLNDIYKWLTDSKFYAFLPEELRKPQKKNGSRSLRERGENLAACIQELQRADLSGSLKNTFKHITGITDIEVERASSGFLNIKTEHTSPSGASALFDLAQESDGTIRLLALLASLYQDVFNMVIVIEEPELSLHPGALNSIVGVIKEAALNNQVIIATQSPDFISEFDVHDLRVVEQRDGMTHIGPLLAHQISIIKDELFTTGDLLRIEELRTLPAEPVRPDLG